MTTVERITCPKCGSVCMKAERLCYHCGVDLHAPPPKEDAVDPNAPTPLIKWDEQPGYERATRTSLVDSVEPGAEQTLAAAALPLHEPGDSQIDFAPELSGPVLVLTFCKQCGYQNADGAHECQRCGVTLEVLESGVLPEIVPVPRAIAFDVLGITWIILGFAAIYSGMFLLRTDEHRVGRSWTDYFWTGVVVCVPGALIVMRHHFCRLMFWVMTLSSGLVWLVIGTIWMLGHLYVSDNAEVGLGWLAMFSILSVASYLTVRVNDAFDYTG